jgi:GGDEF domain-containing protein
VLIDVCSIAPILKAKGREVSNSVLKEMTARILNSIRRSDMASRGYDAGGEAMLDADQFCIVLQGIDDLQGLARVAQRLLDLLKQPVTVAGETFSLSVVASAAAAPQHGVTPEGLLTAVKSALLEARESEAPNAILFNS